MEFREMAKNLIRGINGNLESDPDCVKCRQRAELLTGHNIRRLAMRGPDVGTNYGVSVPRLLLVGLEDPTADISEDPVKQMDTDTADLERWEGPSLHRRGERQFGNAFFAKWGLPEFEEGDSNPFSHLATVNGHLCGLAVNGSGTASSRLPTCPHAWNIVRALKPDVIVVEGIDQIRDVGRLGTWAEQLTWSSKPVQVGKATRNCRTALGRITDGEWGAWVISAYHPSYQGSPWERTGADTYFGEVLLPTIEKVVRHLRDGSPLQ
jgi:hypothetical protein